MPASRRSRLLRWAAEGEERWIVEDDYDSEFRYGGRPISSMQGMDRHGRVIYAGTFSRSLAPAIRLAYMVLPPALLPRWETIYGRQQPTVSRYEQTVMARFLDEGFYVRYIRRDGTIDASSTVPNKLYGILDPNLYLKDKDTLVIFRQEAGVITQYVKKHITIDMENSVIRSDGKYVAQLRITMAFPGHWSQGLFYYGKQEGENQYVYVHIEGWRNVNLPDGLDKL